MALRKPKLPCVLLDNVSCMRNAQQILRHVNVSVHEGGALVLTGANGSGKTTFLRMLAGFSRPSAGHILWNGHDITKSGIFHQYKLQLNWLSLKDAIKDKFTVLDNVQWFEVLEGKQGKSLPALELMGLGRLVKEKAKKLSMGQRKRVQLARLLAMDRPIWLLDEPSVALDADGVKLLEYIIKEHRKQGGIVFVATHLPIDIEDAMYLRLPAIFLSRRCSPEARHNKIQCVCNQLICIYDEMTQSSKYIIVERVARLFCSPPLSASTSSCTCTAALQGNTFTSH